MKKSKKQKKPKNTSSSSVNSVFKRKFPKFISRILQKLIDKSVRDQAMGDFDEQFIDIKIRKGFIKAYFFIISQFFGLFPGFIKNNFDGGLSMFKNYFKTALRNIKRQKLYSFINISGLIIGITCCTLIFLYIQFELSYDKYHENSDRIFRITQEKPNINTGGVNLFDSTPGALKNVLINEISGIETATRLAYAENILISHGDKIFVENNLIFADAELFKIFTFPFVKGDFEDALRDQNSIVISETAAEKYFKNEDPIGKILTYQNSVDFNITGVFKDIPDNSHFRMGFVVPFIHFMTYSGFETERWTPKMYCITYCQLEQNVSVKNIHNQFSGIVEKYIKRNETITRKLLLQPIEKIHLYSDINTDISPGGSIKNIYLLAVTAFLILLISAINYLNLTTSNSLKRSREIGIRKVIGADKTELIKQFLVESTVFIGFAVGVSLLIIIAVSPSFNSFVGKNIPLINTDNFTLKLVFLALMLFTVFIAGAYSAIIISSFKPVAVSKGVTSGRLKSNFFRNSLVVFQFTISIILIITSIVIKNQLDYIKNSDIGYDKDQIIVIENRNEQAQESFETIRIELLKNNNIINATTSAELPHDIQSMNYLKWPAGSKEPEILIHIGYVGYDFNKTFGIEIVKGRDFAREFPADENNAVLINETASDALGWDSPLGKQIKHWDSRNKKIVGVMKDFKFQSLHSAIKPLYFILIPNRYQNKMFVKIKSRDISNTIGYIGKIMQEFSPKYPFEYSFLDEKFYRAYISEQNLRKLYNLFSILAVILASLGLFSLVTQAAEKRTKEIGIRKVLGASTSKILYLISKDFLLLIVLATLTAWPAAYYLSNKWISNFAYRTDIGVMTFITAGLAVLIITIITMSYKSIKAATANPVDSLRDE